MIKKESDEYREPRNVVITLKDNQVLKVNIIQQLDLQLVMEE